MYMAHNTVWEKKRRGLLRNNISKTVERSSEGFGGGVCNK